MALFLFAKPLKGVGEGRFRKYVLERAHQPLTNSLREPISDTELERLHRWLAEGVQSVQAGNQWKFETGRQATIRWSDWSNAPAGDVYDFAIKPAPAPRARAKWSGLIAGRYPSEDLLGRFRDRVFETVTIAGNKVRRCADCPNLYVPTHGRQEYCSRRCSQRVRTRKWRQEHPQEAAELRHRHYRKDIERRRGPAVAAHVQKKARKEA
jgi:hypothetical protein